MLAKDFSHKDFSFEYFQILKMPCFCFCFVFVFVVQVLLCLPWINTGCFPPSSPTARYAEHVYLHFAVGLKIINMGCKK